MPSAPKNFRSIALSAAAALIVVGCASTTPPTDTTPTTDTTPEPTTPTATDTTQGYEDGIYAAAGNYTSPAGAESVDITVTLQNGIITDATFNGHATHPASIKWQGNFAAGFKEEVVGKSIDSVSLGVVNGSSLAPKGFMDALQKIKNGAA